MKEFAKLFTFPDIGQVLVTIDQAEGEATGPEVKVSFNGGNGLGVCQAKFNFSDDENGWEGAERDFEAVDEAKAYAIAKDVIDKLAECFPSQAE